MINALKNWQGYFKLCFLLILLVLVTAGVSATSVPLSDSPPNVSLVSQGSNYVTFTWPPVTKALYYEVHYVKNGAPSRVFNVSGTTIPFTGLSAGTYDFYFRTIFEDKASEYVIEEDLIIL